MPFDPDSPVELREVIGTSVAQLRKGVGLTQSELATSMNAAGFGWSRTTVAEVEGGIRPLSIEEFVAIAAFFEVPAWFMLGGAEGRALPVRVGAASYKPADLVHLLTDQRASRDKASKEVRAAIDRLWRGVSRPWARAWRKSGDGEAAFEEARRLAQSRRRSLPGPTYVTTDQGPTRLITFIPPWSRQISFEMLPGEPYVAHDEAEADALARFEAERMVVRIPAYKAYRLREGKR